MNIDQWLWQINKATYSVSFVIICNFITLFLMIQQWTVVFSVYSITVRVVCPHFGPYALSLDVYWFMVNRVCWCCRHATKKIKSPFESCNKFKTKRLFTIILNLFFPCKNCVLKLTGKCPGFGRVSELRAHYPTGVMDGLFIMKWNPRVHRYNSRTFFDFLFFFKIYSER